MPTGARLDTTAFKRKLAIFQEKFPQEVGRALFQETHVLLREVLLRTPVDTGELRASEHVEGPTFDGKRVYTMIVAGGPAAPYAVYVHENLDAHHQVGQAKFIESVLLEAVPFLMARIAKRIDFNRALA